MEHRGKGGLDSIANCVFWNNGAGAGNNFLYCEGGLDLFLEHCLIDADSTADLRSGLSPLHGPNHLFASSHMLWNQNPHLRDTAQGDYRLLLSSPAIDAGHTTWVHRLELLQDLAGAPRILGGLPNLGAYETGPFTPFLTFSDVTCFGQANGLAEVHPLGGFSPYQFHWSEGWLIRAFYSWPLAWHVHRDCQ